MIFLTLRGSGGVLFLSGSIRRACSESDSTSVGFAEVTVVASTNISTSLTSKVNERRNYIAKVPCKVLPIDTFC